MIQKNSLRIGNHVLYNSEICEVFGLLSQNVLFKKPDKTIVEVHYGEMGLMGIVITEQLLKEMCGLINYHVGGEWYKLTPLYFLSSDKRSKGYYTIYKEIMLDECSSISPAFNMYHTLENLFYNLTNSELPTI